MARPTMLTANRTAAARLIARNAGDQELCDLLMASLVATSNGSQAVRASLRGQLQSRAAGEPQGSPLRIAADDLRESLIPEEAQGVSIRGGK